MTNPDVQDSRDLSKLPDFYVAGADEEEIEIPEARRKGIPEGHEQHLYQKDLGQLGKAEFLVGGVKEGNDAGKQYETWTYPAELDVDLAELGSVHLTKMRFGQSRDSDANQGVIVQWGDGEFTGVDLGQVDYEAADWTAAAGKKNTDQTDLGDGRIVFRERLNPDAAPDEKPVYHYYETRFYEAKPVIATLELPAIGQGKVDGERPLVTTIVRLKRVEANRDSTEGVQGRVKLAFEVEQPGEAAAG